MRVILVDDSNTAAVWNPSRVAAFAALNHVAPVFAPPTTQKIVRHKQHRRAKQHAPLCCRISKQAVGKLVKELEDIGALERIPDPEDGRARLIRFSRLGQQGLLEGLVILSEMENEIAEQVGVENMKSLHSTLLAMLAVLEERAREEETNV